MKERIKTGFTEIQWWLRQTELKGSVQKCLTETLNVCLGMASDIQSYMVNQAGLFQNVLTRDTPLTNDLRQIMMEPENTLLLDKPHWVR